MLWRDRGQANRQSEVKTSTSYLQLLAASQGAQGSSLITRAGCPDQPAAELGAPQQSSPCPCPTFVLQEYRADLGDPSHLCQGATTASHCPPGSQQKTEVKKSDKEGTSCRGQT